ncbi:hypothetical protein F5B20DRAFT_588049 [Whalleya microplaca]|nr:hypothetical protein F5B20DRAFT_588049 [Whalleya microplaca]
MSSSTPTPGEHAASLNQPSMYSSLPEVDTRQESTLEPVPLTYSNLEAVNNPQYAGKVEPPSYESYGPAPEEIAEPGSTQPSPPWWKRHLTILIIIAILVIIGAIAGGVAGGLTAQSSRHSSSSASMDSSTTSTATSGGSPTATSATSIPTNDVYIGTAKDAAKTFDFTVGFEITGKPDAQCAYEAIAPETENPCSRPFTLATNNVSYTWEGCGGDTWVQYGAAGDKLGSCRYKTQTWTCGTVTVKGNWVCGSNN